ncbi:cation transport protein ChaC [Tranquillimonas rosea]|uniref:glutathione-specific gamma-glutamylcyclotransferase n=1 Tax=Tranquillimonas rosea TaxID=641238 RepID=A0A1H9RJQ8_9RHOB|nr:gamma-glutamylcyclotransferase [Tranquillimonas rosea]SER72263.1 cation transport protein ChaC [Tranquillimonas rosea]
MHDTSLWVFGYGSLIWNPGFPVAERHIATLPGHSRSFCMRSIHHRGTSDRPGLVLALDPTQGSACHGIGFRVRAGAEEETVDYLRERELVSAAYLEAEVAIRLEDGREVDAMTFVIDPHHEQYVHGLPLEDQARIIAAAHGGKGPNAEYLYNTTAHLAELGIADAELEWLAARVREIEAEGAS